METKQILKHKYELTGKPVDFVAGWSKLQYINAVNKVIALIKEDYHITITKNEYVLNKMKLPRIFLS